MNKDKNNLTNEQAIKNFKELKFEKPSVTIDNLLFAIDEIESKNIRKLNEKRLQVLLVRREEHPFFSMWSLPGTFVKLNETLEEASLRCLEIKTKLKDVYLEQLYTFGDIKRDPRGRILSVSYMGLVDKKSTIIKSDDNTAWFTLKVSCMTSDSVYSIIFDDENGIVINTKIKLEKDKITVLDTGNLAFDHAKIIFYGLMRMRNKLEYSDIAFSMLSETFTMAELQQVYEIILNKKFTKTNFQRKIKDKVKEVNEYKTGGYRPAKLYSYNK